MTDERERLRQALAWALRNDGRECPADDPAEYARAMRILLSASEDDPAVWASWLATVRKYAPEYVKLVRHLKSEDGAAEVLASTMLSVLADQHGLYLTRKGES